MLYSKQMANIYAVPNIKNNTLDESGKIRIGSFDYNSSKGIKISEVIQLCKLPASNIKIIQINLWIKGFAQDCNIALSLKDKYTKSESVIYQGVIEVKNIAGLLQLPLNLPLNSEEGYILELNTLSAIINSTMLSGHILYVVE